MTVTSASPVAMVRPPRVRVSHPLADLRAAPDAASELVDQAHAGDALTVLGDSGDWAYVQGEDLYFGWILRQWVGPDRQQPEQIVARHGVTVRREPSLEAGSIGEADAGAACGGSEQGWARCAGGWVADADRVAVDDLPQRYPTIDDLLATAESFLGVPYLWGGTSARGIDCSGLTQRVYRLNGVGLDRDADQQALAGRPVDVARPGDLFFFGADRVTHTAIATGETTFIHAPQAGRSVQRGELGADRSRLRAIRRYLL